MSCSDASSRAWTVLAATWCERIRSEMSVFSRDVRSVCLLTVVSVDVTFVSRIVSDTAVLVAFIDLDVDVMISSFRALNDATAAAMVCVRRAAGGSKPRGGRSLRAYPRARSRVGACPRTLRRSSRGRGGCRRWWPTCVFSRLEEFPKVRWGRRCCFGGISCCLLGSEIGGRTCPRSFGRGTRAGRRTSRGGGGLASICGRSASRGV